MSIQTVTEAESKDIKLRALKSYLKETFKSNPKILFYTVVRHDYIDSYIETFLTFFMISISDNKDTTWFEAEVKKNLPRGVVLNPDVFTLLYETKYAFFPAITTESRHIDAKSREAYRETYKSLSSGNIAKNMVSYNPTKWPDDIRKPRVRIVSTNINERENVTTKLQLELIKQDIYLRPETVNSDYTLFILSEPFTNLYVLITLETLLNKDPTKNIIYINSTVTDDSTIDSFLAYTEKRNLKVVRNLTEVYDFFKIGTKELIDAIYKLNPHLARPEMVYAIMPPCMRRKDKDESIYNFFKDAYNRLKHETIDDLDEV